jgi:hypothetical protein
VRNACGYQNLGIFEEFQFMGKMGYTKTRQVHYLSGRSSLCGCYASLNRSTFTWYMWKNHLLKDKFKEIQRSQCWKTGKGREKLIVRTQSQHEK